MKLSVLILFLIPLSLFGQFRGIYVKFESNQEMRAGYTSIYITGQKNVQMRQVAIPSTIFYPLWLDECKPVQIIIEDYQGQLHSFQTLGFLCGDSVIINTDNGYSKVINRHYSEYEQNYYFYRNEYFANNKFDFSTTNWKALHQYFNHEKKFIKELFEQHKLSDSLYHWLLLDLPYKVNNYILRAPYPEIKMVRDSLINCKWYKDSLINTESYLEYVTGYIYNFELFKIVNDVEKDKAFFDYAYNNTSGSLREQLCYWHLMGTRLEITSNYLNQFENFKKITSNKNFINEIEEKIKKFKNKNLLQ